VQFDFFPARAGREALSDWREAGHVSGDSVAAAWRAHRLQPNADQWRQVLQLGALAGGSLALAAGVVFFFAYNWAALSAFAKFGILAAIILLATVAAIVLSAKPRAAAACLFFAQVVTGVLLATIGQTYQTGADAYQLFAVWAGLGLLWALAARVAPLWWLVIVLAQLAMARYLDVHIGFGLDVILMNAFGGTWLNAALPQLLGTLMMLAAWEALARFAPGWGFRGETGPRLLIMAACGFAFWLGVSGLFASGADGRDSVNTLRVLLAFGALAALLAYYRLARINIFALAFASLAASILITLALGRLMGNHWGDLWLPLGFLLIGLSTASAFWLKGLFRRCEGGLHA
jgi:uncharacterized membrane protein